jgi:predicted dehydrogenase
MMAQGLRIGLVGAGFIGRSHALAVKAVGGVFPDCPPVIAECVADADAARAEAIARQVGFRSHTSDWRAAVDASDAVIVAVPSEHHFEIASAVIAAGKPLLCEKPVGLSADQAARLAAAAARAGVINAVGYTYLRAPLVRQAKVILDGGRLGRPLHFTGRHFEDYLASPDAPFSWRLDRARAGRCGALGDLGCHILSIARYLLGPVERLAGASTLVHPVRRLPDGGSRAVENEDHAAAMVRFAGGVPGTIEVSRVASGRKMDLSFEVTCERGAIRFDAERTNELQVYLDEADPAGPGFRRVLARPGHPDYAGFLPAPGHGLGFNDLKTIEIAEFLRGVAAGRSVYPDLAEAARIGRLCEAILDSSDAGRWIDGPEEEPSTRRPAA